MFFVGFQGRWVPPSGPSAWFSGQLGLWTRPTDGARLRFSMSSAALPLGQSKIGVCITQYNNNVIYVI
jgi:hypothetical protein